MDEQPGAERAVVRLFAVRLALQHAGQRVAPGGQHREQQTRRGHQRSLYGCGVTQLDSYGSTPGGAKMRGMWWAVLRRGVRVGSRCWGSCQCGTPLIMVIDAPWSRSWWSRGQTR